MIASLPTDICSGIPRHLPMMCHITQEFVNHTPDSPKLKTLWTHFVFLSFFRSKDRDYLRFLHKDPTNDRFLLSLSKYFTYYSQRRGGFLWIGGLNVEPKKMSNEFPRWKTHYSKCHELYDHYFQLIHGTWISHSLFLNVPPHIVKKNSLDLIHSFSLSIN